MAFSISSPFEPLLITTLLIYNRPHRQWFAFFDVPQCDHKHMRPAVHFHCGVAAIGQWQAFLPRLSAVGPTEIVDQAHRVSQRRENGELVAGKVREGVPEDSSNR